MRKNKIRSDKAKRRAQRDSAEKTSKFGLDVQRDSLKLRYIRI
jgi:hypothetical protein